MVSICFSRAKCSGAKVGIPSNCTGSLEVQSVSPIEKMPGSKTPMISPAYAVSTIFLSSAIIWVDWFRRIFFPPCTWVTSMPASYSPEQIRMKAILSRWALFMLAWILKTKAEKKSSFMGSTKYCVSVSAKPLVVTVSCFAFLASGEVVI